MNETVCAEAGLRTRLRVHEEKTGCLQTANESVKSEQQHVFLETVA